MMLANERKVITSKTNCWTPTISDHSGHPVTSTAPLSMNTSCPSPGRDLGHPGLEAASEVRFCLGLPIQPVAWPKMTSCTKSCCANAS